jgi:S1-C subfamily serine protease
MSFHIRAQFVALSAMLLSPAIALAASATLGAAAIDVREMNITRTAVPTAWNSAVDPGTKIGVLTHGLFCTDGKDFFSSKELDSYLGAALRRYYLERAQSLGYPKFNDAGSLFEAKTGEPDFKLGFSLQDVNYQLCMSPSGPSAKGSASIELRVELYSAQAQKVVYSRVVDSRYSSDSSIKASDFDKAFLMSAIDQIFADPAFVEVFKSGGNPVTEATASIPIPAATKLSGGVSKNTKALLSAVVTIDSGHATGSGFYISRDGYLLTNVHVVGSAKYVKVKLAEGHSLVGEVVKTDGARDVALVKTDSSPATVMPIRDKGLQIGEEVFAIGSPFGEVLSGTLTRGVVSGLREIDHHNFVQSDAAINPGNSGGPLLDASGSVVAIANIKASDGIALFIPIGEALDKLGLKLAN